MPTLSVPAGSKLVDVRAGLFPCRRCSVAVQRPTDLSFLLLCCLLLSPGTQVRGWRLLSSPTRETPPAPED